MSTHEHNSPAPANDPTDRALEDAVMRKVSWRLLPFLFLLFVMNIMDRVNVGFAGLKMFDGHGMSKEEAEAVFGLGAGLFFIGYFLFELPSNLILKRVGARRWIARILVSWGLISVCMMFVVDKWSFYGLRFLLGLAEAGFFPGIILYLSYWFPARQRAKAVARFATGVAVANLLGSPISGTIMHELDEFAGLHGWQWMFVLEGLPTVLLGFVTFWYLTDSPKDAHWLTPTERAWLVERMRQEEAHREREHGLTLWQALTDRRVLLLCLVYFASAMGGNTYGNYQPKILKLHFPEPAWNTRDLGLLSMLPAAFAALGMLLVATSSDRTGERRWHVAVAACLSALGWCVVVWAPAPWVVVCGLALAFMGALSMLPPFWSLPTSYLSGTAAAGGIALINSIGNLGGFVAPFVIGARYAATGTYDQGLLFMAGVLLVGGLLVLLARHDATLERRAE